jgi:hypothetical protein
MRRSAPLRTTAVVAAAGGVSVPPAWPGYVPAPKASKQHQSGPKPFSLLGSTGSIGTQTLDIAAEFPDQYKVVALSAGSNVALLAEQVCALSNVAFRCAGFAQSGSHPGELRQRAVSVHVPLCAGIRFPLPSWRARG